MVKRFYCNTLAVIVLIPVIVLLPVCLIADAVREAAWVDRLFSCADWLFDEADRD